jgi:hypothetical protein
VGGWLASLYIVSNKFFSPACIPFPFLSLLVCWGKSLSQVERRLEQILQREGKDVAFVKNLIFENGAILREMHVRTQVQKLFCDILPVVSAHTLTLPLTTQSLQNRNCKLPLSCKIYFPRFFDPIGMGTLDCRILK